MRAGRHRGVDQLTIRRPTRGGKSATLAGPYRAGARREEAGMKAGIIVPQGWTGDYDGWDAAQAWSRTVAVARQAERLGFESVWLFDHFTTVPRPTDEITFESFTSLAALAAVTSRV